MSKIVSIATVVLAVSAATVGCVARVAEKDLLVAKCVLVERIKSLSVVGGETSFEVGVKCPPPESPKYFDLLSAEKSDSYAIALDETLDGEPKQLVVFYCDEDWGGVANRIELLNAQSSVTGLKFRLHQSSPTCLTDAAGAPGLLTNAKVKFSDRKL